MGSEPMTTDLDPEDEEDEDDSEDALSEFDFLGSGEDGEGAGEARISGDGRELGTLLPQWHPSAPALPVSLPSVNVSFRCLILCSPSYLLLLIVCLHLFVWIKPNSFPNHPSLCPVSWAVSLWIFPLCSAVISVCGCTLCVRGPCQNVVLLAAFLSLAFTLHLPCHLFNVCMCFCIGVILRRVESFTGPVSLCCVLKEWKWCCCSSPVLLSSITPTSLRDWMFCVSLLLSGSENRRNKLQGMMSDFPPKPTPSPSISGQARPGEGKTWQTVHMYACSSDFNLEFRCCHVSVYFLF